MQSCESANMGLDNLTLRVPTELRAKAEKAAQDAGHTLATELRNALATHYKINTPYFLRLY